MDFMEVSGRMGGGVSDCSDTGPYRGSWGVLTLES